MHTVHIADPRNDREPPPGEPIIGPSPAKCGAPGEKGLPHRRRSTGRRQESARGGDPLEDVILSMVTAASARSPTLALLT